MKKLGFELAVEVLLQEDVGLELAMIRTGMPAEKHPLATGAGSPGLSENSAAMSVFPALLKDLSKLVEEPKTANSTIASGVQPRAITRATVSMMSSRVPRVRVKAPAQAEEETASVPLPASLARPERTPSVPVVPFVIIPSLLPKEDGANPKLSLAIPSAPMPEGKDEPLAHARGSDQSRDRVSPLASKGADAGNRAKPRGHGTSPIPEFSTEVAPVAESALQPAMPTVPAVPTASVQPPAAKPQAGPATPALAGQTPQNQTVPMAPSPAVAPGAPVQEAHFTRTIDPEEKGQAQPPVGGQTTLNRSVPAAPSLGAENTIATGQGVQGQEQGQEQEPEPWFPTLPADVPVPASLPVPAVPRPATRPIQSRAALATLPVAGKAAPSPALFSVVAATEGNLETPRREAAAESPTPTAGVAPRVIETTDVAHPSAPAKVLAFSGTLVREPDSGDDRKIQTTEPVKPQVTVDRPALPVAVVRDVESGDRQPQPVAAPAPEPDPVRIPVVSGSDTGRPSAREGKSAEPAKPKVAVAGERIRPEEPVDLEPVFMPGLRTSLSAPVQTPAAPPAPSFAATRPEPQAIPAPEPVVPELPKTSITPLGARDIRLDLNSGGQHVAVRVADAGGKVNIAVHTSDSSLAGTLRDDLPSLSTRLEETGLKAESWQTGASAAPASESSSARAVEPLPAIHSIDRPEVPAWTRVESTPSNPAATNPPATNPPANGPVNHPATPWHAGAIPWRRDPEPASGGNARDLPGGGGQKQPERESHSERNQQQQSNRKQKGNPFAWFMSSVR